LCNRCYSNEAASALTTLLAWNGPASCLGDKVVYVRSSDEAAHNSDALLILAEGRISQTLISAEFPRNLKYPLVIDDWNLYDPGVIAAQGFTYNCIGRAASHPDGVPIVVMRDGKKA
jgi:hypothetical protein